MLVFMGRPKVRHAQIVDRTFLTISEKFLNWFTKLVNIYPCWSIGTIQSIKGSNIIKIKVRHSCLPSLACLCQSSWCIGLHLGLWIRPFVLGLDILSQEGCTTIFPRSACRWQVLKFLCCYNNMVMFPKYPPLSFPVVLFFSREFWVTFSVSCGCILTRIHHCQDLSITWFLCTCVCAYFQTFTTHILYMGVQVHSVI